MPARAVMVASLAGADDRTGVRRADGRGGVDQYDGAVSTSTGGGVAWAGAPIFGE